MKAPITTIVIAIALTSTYFIFGSMPNTLIFNTAAPQSWHWISSHFVHISFEHLIWNLVAFVGLGSIIEQHSVRRLLLSLGFGIVFVNLYLATLFPMAAYAGLSGVLNSLLVVALFQIFQIPEYRLATVLSFLASLVKLFYEWVFDTSVFTTLVWPSVPQAHFFGLIGGVVFCSILHSKSKSLRIDNAAFQ